MSNRWRRQSLSRARLNAPQVFRVPSTVRRRNFSIDSFSRLLVDSHRSGRGAGYRNGFHRLTIDEDTMPYLEVQQTPDSIPVIAQFRTMLAENPLYSARPKQPSFHRSWFQKHALQVVKLRSRQPVFPWCWKAHFLAIYDRPR